MRRALSSFLVLLLLVACARAAEDAASPGLGAAAIPDIRLAPALPHLDFDRPVCMAWPDDGSGRIFIVEQAGVIHAFKPSPDVAQTKVFLDIRPKVRTWHNEEGLLALAFHPRFKDNGQLFVFYSLLEEGRLASMVSGKTRVNVLARYTVKPGAPDVADPASERILLRIEKPYGNHNGSTLVFGPDGFLYCSAGDGGAAGDPHDNGQSLATHLGKILRIDVDHEQGGLPYAIPSDNPFAGQSGARPEIWAYGLRNVWRMSFDRKTGELYAGDVGQNLYEELDLVTKGGNYGWRLREGMHPFKTSASGAGDAKGAKLVEPIAEYGRDLGACVTGGYVYRGGRYPSLQGVYIYADYVSGTFFGLRQEGGKVSGPRTVLQQPKNIASFGEDQSGELYALAFDGHVYHVEAAEPAGPPAPQRQDR